MKTDFTSEEICELIIEWELPRFIFDSAIYGSKIYDFIIKECTKLIKPVKLINDIQDILNLFILDKNKQELILLLINKYEYEKK